MEESERQTLNPEQTLYEVLGVEKTAELDDIRKAYKRLALRYHPDKNAGDPVAAEKFKEISKAANMLSDPTKRALYDRYGAQGIYLSEQMGDNLDSMAPLLLLPRWAVITSCIVTCCYCFGFCCCCCCFCCFCNGCCGRCGKARSSQEEPGPDDFPEVPVIDDREDGKAAESREQPATKSEEPAVIDSQPKPPDFVLVSGS